MSTDELLQKLPNIIGNNRFNRQLLPMCGSECRYSVRPPATEPLNIMNIKFDIEL